MKRLIIACTLAAVFGIGTAMAADTKPSPADINSSSVLLPEVKETGCKAPKEEKFSDIVIEQACLLCCSDRWTCCCCAKGCSGL